MANYWIGHSAPPRPLPQGFEWDVFVGAPPFSISFQDELRTRIEVCSEDPMNGACAFYEKRDGVWVFVQAGSMWAV